MPFRLIPSFLFYCYVNGITPGPANLCSLYAALNYGKERALKQWKGLFTGFAIVALVSVFLNYFLGNVLGDYVKWLSYIGAAYLIWLAVHTVRSAVGAEKDADENAEKDAEKNCNFFTGLLVQLTNVKIILFCMTALSSFVLPYSRSFFSLLLVGVFLPFTGPICNLAWLFAGAKLQKLFYEHRKVINWIMAGALVLCAVSLVWG
ncbi:MAG: LysE family transporter [Lachnospiraceae bacterium]|nr:LysE family transporter [Lachnospiraceae bacterium]